MTYQFNKNYDDYEQVATYLPAFLEVHASILAAGKYPYDDSFKGRIVGLEPATNKDENNAIYMLQTLKRLRELATQVEEAISEGCEPVAEVDGTVRYSRIIEYGFYMGGTGWREWRDARLTNLKRSLFVLPKGRRTNGCILNGKVLVKP